MTADRAKISYDPTRQYRSVIAQQGRVTLEADTNEAATIASEALRLETIDVMGPTGTPDNGYAPSSGSGPGGVSIGPGIFYLGGWRLELDKAIDLSKQPDWLDQPATPITSGNMLVALLLNEQSVCAVEDQALREVALGGPDSAARARLMQHFLRLPLDGRTCAAGAAMLAQKLEAEGVTIDPATLELMSQARLQAGFVPGPAATDPCTPAAAGGYLGADNQLVRVTVIAYDATAKTGTLLWGWNNASILYRAGMTNPVTLTLTGTPVDGEHAPQLGQAVEILRSQANLGDGNFIAAPEGFVTTVAQAYSFDTGELVLADALPGDYQSDTNPLFIRLWQAKVPFVAGQTTALDSVSGITVTVTLPALPTDIALRPFWRFAVRPSTPVQIYPQRYLEAPQPPDGPRQWITDLALMAAKEDGSTLLQDCRVTFVPVTQQPGCKCCHLTLGPDDIAARGGLQAVLDALAGTRSGVSLLPGTYPLAAPVVLTGKHTGLTLEGCGGPATLQADAPNLTPFAIGLIALIEAAEITLRGLTIKMPVVALRGPAGTPPVQLSVGVLASASTGLTVEQCSFEATVPSGPLVGFGFIVIGESAGLAVRRNSFMGGSFASGSNVYGLAASASSATITTALDRADISHNIFNQLGAGVVTFSQLGQLRCANNRVVACRTGLYFAHSNLAAASAVARQGLAAATQPGPNAALALAVNNSMQAPMLASTADSVAQIVARMPQPPTAPVVSETARRVLLQDITARGAEAWRALAASAATQPGGAPAPAGPQPATGAGAAAAAAPIARELSETIAKSLDMVQEIAITAEAAVAIKAAPVRHISGNDVSLASIEANATTTVPGIGIAVVLSPRDESGTVLLTANRVLTADARTIAAALLYPAVAAVTGNAFVQTGAGTQGAAPAFVSIAEPIARIEVMANVIIDGALIVPARATSAPATSWNFLNTVG